jgi:hypothetical protein
MKKLLMGLLSILLVVILVLSGCTETKYVNQTILSTQTVVSNYIVTQTTTFISTLPAVINTITIQVSGGDSTITVTRTNTVTVTANQTTNATTTTINNLMQNTLDLYNAFKANEAAAILKYEGMSIRLEGKVSGITGSSGSNWYVTLYEPSTYNLWCSFNADYIDKIATLVVGQVLQLEGTCDGATMWGDPRLINCQFLP